MGNFTPTGVEFQAKNVGTYLSTLAKADRAQQNLGRSVSGIGSQFSTAQGQTSRFGQQVNSLSFGSFSQKINGIGSSLLDLGIKVVNIGATITATLGAGLAASIGASIAKATTLDDQMAQIAGTMGKTKEEVAPLKDLILQLGLDPNLTVNAQQAADAIEKLGQNGLEMSEILDGAAASTVKLANSTGGNFETAAAVATDTMAIFGLKANEMERAIDGITGVTISSKFGIEDYALALAQGGSVAAEMGVSLQDFNAVIAATSSSFASGSDAGTSFKTLLQRLSNPTDEVKSLMQQYGISLFDASGKMKSMAEIAGQLNQVFSGTVTLTSQVGGATKKQATAAATASKNMEGLKADIATNAKQLQLYNEKLALEIGYYGESHDKVRQRQIQIEKLTNTINDQTRKLGEYEGAISAVEGAQVKTVTSTKKLTEAEKAQLATAIGGADAARILLSLAGVTADEFDNLSGEINKAGLATQSAATRVDSLKGAFDILKGIIETVAIRIGDKFLPGARKLTEWASTFASTNSDKIINFFEGIANVIDLLATGDFKGGIFGLEEDSLPVDVLFRARDTIIGIGQEIQGVIASFQSGGAAGGVANIAIMLGITPAAVSLFNKINISISGVAQTITGFLMPSLKGLSGSDLLSNLNRTIEYLNEHFEEFKGAITGAGAALIAGGIVGALAGIGAAIVALLGPFNLLIAGAALLGAAWAGNWGNIRGVTAQVMTFLTETFNQFVALWLTWWPTIQTVLETTWVAIQGVFVGFQNVAATLAPHFQQVVANLTQGLANLGLNWTDVWNAIKQATALTFSAIGIIILGLVSVVGGIVVAISSAAVSITGTWSALMGNVTNIITQITSILVGFVALVGGLFTGDWSMAWNGFTTALNGVMDFFGAWSELMVTLITGPLDLILSVITGFARGFIDVFAGIYDALIGNSIIPDLVNGISQWVSQIPQKIAAALRGLIDLASKPFEEFMDFAQEILNPEKWEEIGVGVIEGVVAGIESAKDKVLEVLKQMAQDALAGVMDTLGISSPSTEFEYVGRMMAAGVAKGWDDKKGDLMKTIMDFGDIGHFTKLGLSQTKSEHLKGAFKGAVTALFEQIAAGKAGAAQLEALTKQNAGAWAKFVDEGNIAFDHVVKLIKEGGAELAAEIKKQMMDRLVSMGQGFATFGDFLIERMKGQDEAALSAIQSIGDLTKKLDEQKSKLATLKTELGAIAGKYGESSKEVIEKQKAIAALTAEIEKNEKAMADQNKILTKEAKTSKTATISMLQQFLAGSGEFFKFTLQSDLVGVNHVMLDRVKAQEKLNQLLKEEEERQKEIAKIEKAKADLAFLQQQIDLLRLIREQGLDPADILGGIQLGLGASMSDLLKVTSSVIQAMVDQINQDLQIASPSKVMAKIGSRVMQGVGQGLEGGKQKLYQAMDNIPILNGSLASPLPMPAMGMVGGGNNFNGPLVSISVGQVNSPADEDRLVQKAVRAVERKLR